MTSKPLAMLAILAAPLVSARKMTLVNSCKQTIWPGVYASPGPMPDHATGWEMVPGSQEVVEVSDHWQSGRFWARTGCTVQDGLFQCLTGDCHVGTQGESHACQTTNQPATLAEFTLGDAENADHYDVSNVDGFNVPMSITPSKRECNVPECTVNINEICPEVLRAGIDQNGANGACISSCKAGFGEAAGGNRNCCSGEAYKTEKTCSRCGVEYYDVFKRACPDAYAYAYDEDSPGQAIFTCKNPPGSAAADYTIEFCPCGVSFIGSTTPSKKYEDKIWPSESECASKVSEFQAGAKPSPTAAQPQSPLKIKLSDGDKPHSHSNSDSKPAAPVPNSDHSGGASDKPSTEAQPKPEQGAGGEEDGGVQSEGGDGGGHGSGGGDGGPGDNIDDKSDNGGNSGNANEGGRDSGRDRLQARPDVQIDDVQHLVVSDMSPVSTTGPTVSSASIAKPSGQGRCPAKRKRSRARTQL